MTATLPLTQPQSPRVFTARSYGDFGPWHCNLGPGSCMWGWDSHSSGGTSTAGVSLLSFNRHMLVWDILFHVSAPPAGPGVACLGYRLTYRTSFTRLGWFSDGSSGFVSSICTFDVVMAEASRRLPACHLDGMPAVGPAAQHPVPDRRLSGEGHAPRLIKTRDPASLQTS